MAIWTCEEHGRDSVVVWVGSPGQCPACVLQNEVNKLTGELDASGDKVNSLEADVDSLEDEVVEKDARIAELELFLEEEKARE